MDRQCAELPVLPQGFSPETWNPRDYQTRGIEWLLKPAAALFLRPGLGKTSITLAAFLRIQASGIGRRMLVLAPLKACILTWQDEPKKWAQFGGLRVGFAHGDAKHEVLADKSLDIVLLNYEGLAWACGDPAFRQFDVLCCDEITKLKSTKSKRYKLLKPLLQSFKIRWGLTGTPASNGLLDLFGQIYVLDLGQRLGRFITHFRMEYFHQLPWDQFNYYITPEKSKKIAEKLSDLAMYISKEEEVKLPEFNVMPMTFELPAKDMQEYKHLEAEFILRKQEAVITAVNAGVLTSKLRQFTGGAMYDQDRNVINFNTAKLDAVEDLVDQLAGESLLIAYQFDHERVRLLERFPKAVVLKGGQTDRMVQNIVAEWNSEQRQILLVQPAAAAMSLNLQAGGHNICWFTMTYNLEDFYQLNKRLHRQGQTQPVMCYLLTAKGTIDARVSKVLSQKEVTQENLLRALL